MKHCFFVDAETDGLYGPFLSVAALVTEKDGKELDRFYGSVELEGLTIESEWVRENVLPHLPQAETFYPDETALLAAFWVFWMKHREHSICIADVCCPVEARLFALCVMQKPEERTFLAPFPLFDLSTLLLARGIDPLAERQSLTRESLIPHDAMNDVRMTAELWLRFFH